MDEESSKPWEYTDDIIAGVLCGSYVVGHFMGNPLPDPVIYFTMAYVFGKKIIFDHVLNRVTK